jgi:hypothetical protein
MLHEEFRQSQEEKERLMAKAVENAVVVREGDLDWMGKLHDVLIYAGIPCAVMTDAGCKKGRCGSPCRLIVSKDDLERAQTCITEYYMELHPELRASNELITQGKCPACGSTVGPNDTECSDCDLTLMIIEEENQGKEES